MKAPSHTGIPIVVLYMLALSSMGGCTALRTIQLLNQGEAVSQEPIDQSLPFMQEGHVILVKVRINDSENEYDFILDTGALTAISTSIADELGLHDGIEVEASGSGGNSSAVRLVSLETVSVEDVAVRDCCAAVFDFSSIDPDIDGLLGSNFLRHFRLILDFEDNSVILSQKTETLATEPNSIRLSFTQDMTHGFAPRITCNVNGEIRIDGIIDTGSPSIVDLPLSTMEEMQSSRDCQVISSNGSMGGGAFGRDECSYLMRIDSIQLGDLLLKNIPSTSHNGSNLALLGMGFLYNYHVILDYPANELVLTPNSSCEFDTNLLSFGLSLDRCGGSTIITGVWEGSPADRSGLVPGCEILTINSIEASEFSLLDLSQILRDPAIDEIDITYSGADGEHALTLQKERLLPEVDSQL